MGAEPGSLFEDGDGQGVDVVEFGAWVDDTDSQSAAPGDGGPGDEGLPAVLDGREDVAIELVELRGGAVPAGEPGRQSRPSAGPGAGPGPAFRACAGSRRGRRR